MSEVDQKLEFFKNMISSVTNIYVTKVSPRLELISTNAPNSIINLVFFLGADDIPPGGKPQVEQMDPDKHKGVIILLTNRLGMAWISEVETDNNAARAIHILGPVFLNDYSVAEIERELDRLMLTIPVKRAFMKEIHRIPVISLSRFYEYGIMFHYCITGERIGIEDFLFKSDGEPPEQYFEAGKDKERDYRLEQRIMRMIEEGNLDCGKELERMGLPDECRNFGGADLLRQAKNTVITFITLCTRASIRGGLSPAVALALSDIFMQQVEEAPDLGVVNKINHDMLTDIVHRVHEVKLRVGVSPQIRRSCDYISAHLDEKVNIHELASALGYTDYYFSKKFKAETGMGVREYALSKKLEAAKDLLANTSMEINKIAGELGFVNQSYFGDAFKKAVGVSPSDYRNQRNSNS